jgi:hypothetical protein
MTKVKVPVQARGGGGRFEGATTALKKIKPGATTRQQKSKRKGKTVRFRNEPLVFLPSKPLVFLPSKPLVFLPSKLKKTDDGFQYCPVCEKKINKRATSPSNYLLAAKGNEKANMKKHCKSNHMDNGLWGALVYKQHADTSLIETSTRCGSEKLMPKKKAIPHTITSVTAFVLASALNDNPFTIENCASPSDLKKRLKRIIQVAKCDAPTKIKRTESCEFSSEEREKCILDYNNNNNISEGNVNHVLPEVWSPKCLLMVEMLTLQVKLILDNVEKQLCVKFSDKDFMNEQTSTMTKAQFCNNLNTALSCDKQKEENNVFRTLEKI